MVTGYDIYYIRNKIDKADDVVCAKKLLNEIPLAEWCVYLKFLLKK